MILYVNGDSNLAGTEVKQSDTIVERLRQKLLPDQIDNQALIGASNDRIYDSSMAYLEQNNPNFVLIGWSDAGRMQVHNKETGKWNQLNSIGVGHVPTALEPLTKLLKDKMSWGSDHYKHMAFYWHYKIYNMHSYLLYRNIPHLFFTALSMWTGKNNITIEDKYKLDWNNNYFEVYNDCYMSWCMRNNYRQVTPGWYHFVKEGQHAWADKLYDHIEKHNII